MKVTCCCFTCIIGEEKGERTEENNRLLQSDNDDALPPVKQSRYSRSPSALSSSSTMRGLSTESGEPLSESLDGSGPPKEKFSKAVNVLKKYNVMSSKYKTKELERQMSLPARLRIRIGLKLMTMSNTVKVSVIEATDVMHALKCKGLPDSSASSDQEESLIVQVRTKILHSEVRGHTKKYEIQGALSGPLKFKSESVHAIGLDEFLHSKIRFRFYCVMKHTRDKLLGECTLDVETLNYDKNQPTPFVVLDLYDSAVSEFGTASSLSPGVTSRAPSYESQPSTDNDTRGSTTPKIQRQAKIRGQDSELRSSMRRDAEKTDDSADKSGEESSIRKAFGKLRGSASKDKSMDSIESAAASNEFEHLKVSLSERTKKIGDLEDSSAAMADSAGNFSMLSVKLKEKYKSKVGKSKSSDS